MPWTKVGNIRGPGLTDLGVKAVGQSATLLAIAAGIRTVVVDVTGLAVGDTIVLTPTAAVPNGYLIGLPYCATAGKLSVPIYAPGMVIGAAYSIACHVQVAKKG